MELKVFKEINEDLLDVILELEKSIFEIPYSREKFLKKIKDKRNILALLIYENEKACAFKIGYEMKPGLYYSWVGGVLPEFRKNGFALELMKKQHELVTQLGYERIRTHTENKFRSMLILNLKFGFDIIELFNSDSDGRSIIALEKNLIN